MPKPEPLEARCDGCQQMRPVFLYEPDCGLHLDPALQFGCQWCCIEMQPMLCIRCGDKRKLEEENDDRVNADFSLLDRICRTNARLERQRQADTETVEGIARATTEGGSDA